jgi:DNA-binding NarL/FixJ family response regulator
MKILVIDDHPLVSDALRHLARSLGPGTEVLSAAHCEAGFEIAVAHADLDLVLLDLHLPGLAGVPAVKEWRRRFPAVPVVVVSATEEQPSVLAAIAAGAAGFIPKSSPSEVLLSALNLVLSGGRYVPPQAIGPPPPRRRRETVPSIDNLGLTPRQLEVLRLIAQGKPNKLICRELGLAERTVKAHLSAVFRALQVTSRTQAALAAARLGLVPPVR